MSAPPPASASPLTHLKRAFGWNLGAVVPSGAEAAGLAAAGVTDPVVQRYAAWRRSLLLVAAVATFAAFALAVVDTVESGFGELTRLGVGLELTWLASAGVLPLAALIGVLRWKRPGAAAGPLLAAWVAAFLIPFVYALLPAASIYHVGPITAPPAATPAKPATATPAKAAPKAAVPADPEADEDEDDPAAMVEAAVAADPAKLERDQALEEMAVEFVLSGGGYLLLLPAVLSLIPGALNGCLRIKALIPAAQLPGWLLVCAAPSFLLFWLVILVIANHAARSPLLVAGVVLWAGSPVLYSAFGRVFTRPQISGADAARIGRVKKLVGLTALAGIGLLIAFVLTAKVAGLKVVGFDRATAVATKIDDLSDDDELSLEDVQAALAESKSFLYAFDLSSYRLLVDSLAKLLVVTAIFSDLVLRATLAAWRNDRTLAARTGGSGYDADAAALAAALG